VITPRNAKPRSAMAEAFDAQQIETSQVLGLGMAVI
jgi:hypothetical protein